MHSAVLLAGGKSSRMGRDKSMIEIDGELLWKRQLAKLQQTSPAELFIACGQNARFQGLNQLHDTWPDKGPLGGIHAALASITTSWLLVLAVDMPFMPVLFLRKLIQQAESTQRSVIPFAESWEPLAAVYHQSALACIESQMRKDLCKLSLFAEALLQSDLATQYVLNHEERAFFANWNEPGDIQ
jgi:molybdopterin-guanine dinucleotide biosynthesis protein A